MRKLDTTKLTVLSIGILALMIALLGAIKDVNPIGYGFGMYIGITLIGTVVLHKEKVHNTIES